MSLAFIVPVSLTRSTPCSAPPNASPSPCALQSVRRQRTAWSSSLVPWRSVDGFSSLKTAQRAEHRQRQRQQQRQHRYYDGRHASSHSYSYHHPSYRVRVTPTAEISVPTPQEDDLHWKDRVALYAQFSAEETLHALLHALQRNDRTGPRKDDGIDALYSFANVDIWALSHRFFGKTQDLGQFERFKRVVVAHPYNILLRQDYKATTLSALHVTPDTYVSRKAFSCPGLADHSQTQTTAVFTFTMCRMQFGGGSARAWMVDSIIHDDSETATASISTSGSGLPKTGGNKDNDGK